jgi:membrane protein YqaA with SNARE-associated domain
MLGRSFLRARWSAFSDEDVVTGEIVAPVTRSRLVRYVKTFSEHRYGRWVLAAIAFADSSFLPIPPDLLLVPMALVRPKQIWALSLICTVASSLGAVVGYLIGYGLWSLVGVPLVELYGYGNGFTAYQHLIEKWGVWIIIAKSLTPVPFKIMAIAAGVAAMSPTAFLASAVAGRALHFAIVATLIALWGDRVMGLLSRYGRALAIISLLGLIGIAVVQHLR